MKNSQVVIDNPLIIDGRKITPIARVIRYHLSEKNKQLIVQLKVPVAVIITTATMKKQIYRISGESITWEQLIEDFPQVSELLNNLK
jgi:hypothetical protein